MTDEERFESAEQRLAKIELSLLQFSALMYGLAQCNADLNERLTAMQQPAVDENLAPPAVKELPQEGYLDCETFVLGRLGHADMKVANQFGQACTRAAPRYNIEPIKMASPGEHWDTVNTWPIEFLKDIWFLTFGGV